MSNVYEVPSAGVDRIPDFDPRAGEHLWVMPVVFRVEPSTWRAGEQVIMDHENLLYAGAYGCFHCEQQFSDHLAARRCKGRP